MKLENVKNGINNVVTKVTKPSNKRVMDMEINRILEELQSMEITDVERNVLMSQLEYMINIQGSYKKKEKNNGFDINEVLKLGASTITAATGLISIAMILGYEKEDIITSKGLSIATKFLGK